MAVSYEPMKHVRSAGGTGFPKTKREGEGATQTFNLGVPTMLSSGNLVELTTAADNLVYGVNYEPPHNLTTANTSQELSEAKPPNQPSGVTTPVGAWVRDGKLGVYLANSENVFSIMMKDGQTFAQADLVAGTKYGIVKDATTGFWFLDETIVAGNAIKLTLLGVDPSSKNTVADGARVWVMFATGERYFD